MDSEIHIIDSLSALAYEGPCLQTEGIIKALEGGSKDEDFRELVCWLTEELHILRKTYAIAAESRDPSKFAMELSAMIMELGCPYVRFVTGPLSERFQTREICSHLLVFLMTELMATKMAYKIKPAQKELLPKPVSSTARTMERLSRDVGLGEPPWNMSSKAFFDKLNSKVEELARRAKPEVLSEPLLRLLKPLTEAQWKKLDTIQAGLDAEYKTKRQTLLTRLDELSKHGNRNQRILHDFDPLRYGTQDTTIVGLLAARVNLAITEKAGSAKVQKETNSKIQKHVMGSVPDRGAQAREQAPKMPEQQRSSAPECGRGRGGGDGFANTSSSGSAGGIGSANPTNQSSDIVGLPGASKPKGVKKRKRVRPQRMARADRRMAEKILERYGGEDPAQLSETHAKSLEWARSIVDSGDHEPAPNGAGAGQVMQENGARKRQLSPERNAAMNKRVRGAGNLVTLGVLNMSRRDGAITKEEWSWLDCAISKAYMTAVIENPGPRPSFEYSGWYHGFRLITCADERSANIFKKIISLVGEVFDGARLKAVDKKDLPIRPMAHAVLPAEPSQAQKILELLQYCNPGLPTQNWKVMEVGKANGPTRRVMLLLNAEAIEPLSHTGGTVSYGIERVVLSAYHDRK